MTVLDQNGKDSHSDNSDDCTIEAGKDRDGGDGDYVTDKVGKDSDGDVSNDDDGGDDKMEFYLLEIQAEEESGQSEHDLGSEGFNAS